MDVEPAESAQAGIGVPTATIELASDTTLTYVAVMSKPKTPFDLALYESPTDKLLRESALDRLQRVGISSGVEDVINQIRSSEQTILPSSFLQDVYASQKAFEEAARPYGGLAEMARKLTPNHDLHFEEYRNDDVLRQLDLARATHWASALAKADLPNLDALYSRLPDVLSVATGLREQAQLSLPSHVIDQLTGAGHFGVPDHVRTALLDTSLKMSVLSGLEFTTGFDAPIFQEAYFGLLGNWRTRPDLPSAFWDNPAVREDRYREAEVDPGIIAAEPSATVEIMVESGFAVGKSGQGGTVAIFTFGGVSVSVSSNSAEVDAHSAIVAFERSLRAFISKKLEAHVGPKWFRQRVPGDINSKARERREAALKLGETSALLLDYTDFGELMQIVIRRDNWEELFEAVFVDADRFKHDMLTLLAIRRPTAHSRIIDSTQLVEAMFVMRRLDARMTNDGSWRLVVEADN